jgi:DNA polymerase I-like protein with 3'-5' exonuclease and polymerase domains
MTATELLHSLQRRGVCITLSVSGDKLHVKAPKDVLTSEVEACIIAHKPALLALLSAHPHRVEKPAVTLITAEQMVNYLTALTKRFGQSHMTLALDLETTGTNFLEERIVAIALGKPGQIVVLDVRPYYDLAATEQAQWRQALAGFLHLPGLCVIGHHLKCDWKFLAGHLGVKLRSVYDTMLVEQVLHGVGPNDARNAVSLQATAARYGITVSKEQSAWYLHLHQRPQEWAAPFQQEQLIYMAQDMEVRGVLADLE